MKLGLSNDARPQGHDAFGSGWLSSFSGSFLCRNPTFRSVYSYFHPRGGHAIAALLTGNSVGGAECGHQREWRNLHDESGLISQTLVSSAVIWAQWPRSVTSGANPQSDRARAGADRLGSRHHGANDYLRIVTQSLLGGNFRNSFYIPRRHAVVDWVDCRRAFCETEVGDFLRKLSCCAVRSECPARSENRIFPFFSLCTERTD